MNGGEIELRITKKAQAIIYGAIIIYTILYIIFIPKIIHSGILLIVIYVLSAISILELLTKITFKLGLWEPERVILH